MELSARVNELTRLQPIAMLITWLLSVLQKADRELSTVQDFVLQFADVSNPDGIRSSHALDMLVDIYGGQASKRDEAVKVSRCAFVSHEQSSR